MSPNSQPKSAESSNSLECEKKPNSNALENIRNYTLKSFRELITQIKIASRGKLQSNQAISRACSWDKSRVNQILGNFKKFFPKTKEKQDEIWKKLTDTLESFNRQTKQGDEQNEESTSGN